MDDSKLCAKESLNDNVVTVIMLKLNSKVITTAISHEND